MNNPRTYNEFVSWFNAKKMAEYFQIEPEFLNTLYQLFLENGSVMGDSTGFTILDSNGKELQRVSQTCRDPKMASLRVNNKKLTYVGKGSGSSGGSSGGSSNNNNNNNNN